MVRRLRAGLIAVALSLAACRPAPLPVYSTLPPFSLTAQDGRAFGSAELKGRVWVANFIFTRCPTVCPTFTAEMARVDKALEAKGAPVTLVSFSVDPAYDTPERLTEYAKAHGADWTFLTGSPEALHAAVVDGLKVAAVAPKDGDDLASVVHGTYFVLVDGEGRIRGYYASTEPGAVDAVVRDALALSGR